jgi:adenosylhomocysteine nucleosidase
LKVGEVVRPGTVINSDDGSRTLVSGGTGVLVSFGSVASPEQKTRLREAYGAELVDMEAAAVARSAEARNKQFTAVKAVSDEADFHFPAMDRFVDSEGRFSQARFALFAAMRPCLWPRVMQLARNTSRASHNLFMYLRTISA